MFFYQLARPSKPPISSSSSTHSTCVSTWIVVGETYIVWPWLRASSTPADHEFFRADDFTGTCRNETKQQRRPKFPGKTSPVPTRARRMQHTTYGDFADIWPGPELHMHPINYKLRRILLLLIRGF
ncbi:hypothetical protein BS78_07G048100 [Paspalum vaginatum]|nr:hypothetical protein BS78_07G048100 [Paspalum vaginatum]